jgi:transcriptional regulator with PAS, ATPase and Fis domain
VTKDSWVQQFAGAITVCNAQGTILEMNDKAVQAFQEQGGRALIGTDVLDCHPEPARTRLQRMLKTQQANVYTVEKRGVKKLIYQTPWYKDGQYAGFIELVLEIPAETPHFLRDG